MTTERLPAAFTLYKSDYLTLAVRDDAGNYGYVRIVVENDGGVLVQSKELPVRLESTPAEISP